MRRGKDRRHMTKLTVAVSCNRGHRGRKNCHAFPARVPRTRDPQRVLPSGVHSAFFHGLDDGDKLTPDLINTSDDVPFRFADLSDDVPFRFADLSDDVPFRFADLTDNLSFRVADRNDGLTGIGVDSGRKPRLRAVKCFCQVVRHVSTVRPGHFLQQSEHLHLLRWQSIRFTAETATVVDLSVKVAVGHTGCGRWRGTEVESSGVERSERWVRQTTKARRELGQDGVVRFFVVERFRFVDGGRLGRRLPIVIGVGARALVLLGRRSFLAEQARHEEHLSGKVQAYSTSEEEARGRVRIGGRGTIRTVQYDTVVITTARG